MGEEKKIDVFDRSKRSKIKSEEWKVPNQLRAFVKKKQSKGDDIQEYIDKPIAFKDITFRAFGVSISEVKEVLDKDSSLFIIYCGGERREKDYLSYIIEFHTHFSKIKIRYITGTDQIDELTEQAIKDIKDGLGGVDVSDMVYLLTDMDTFRDDIIKQKPICCSNNINLIVSNPCFEIWLYYSQFEIKPDFIPSAPEKISNEFKGHVHKVAETKGGVDPCKALFLIETANKNSSKNYSEDKDELPVLFSTQMHLLGEKLFENIKDELKSLEVYFDDIKKTKMRI